MKLINSIEIINNKMRGDKCIHNCLENDFCDKCCCCTHPRKYTHAYVDEHTRDYCRLEERFRHHCKRDYLSRWISIPKPGFTEEEIKEERLYYIEQETTFLKSMLNKEIELLFIFL